MERDQINAKLAKVDATAHTSLGARFGVNGYPTIRFFMEGDLQNPIEYTGERNEKGIVNWVQKRSSGNVSEYVESQEQLDQLKADRPILVVYYGVSENDPKFKVFKSIAMQNDDLQFAHVFDDDIKAKEKAMRVNLVVYKHFDEKRNNYDQFFGAKYIERFLDNVTYPQFAQFNQRMAKKFQRSTNMATFFLFLEADGDDALGFNQSALQELQQASEKYKGKYLFTYCKRGDDNFSKFQEQFGFDETSLPQIIVAQSAARETKKYRFEYQITQKDIDSFVNQFKAGKIKKYLKSQPIPEKSDEHVVTVVGENWEEVVKKNKKDVLVEFYAPWCGHCKALAPKYEQLARKLANNPNLVIAKIDLTANEVPGVSINGYPTLKLYTSKSKTSPITYEGDREVDQLIKWLKENATHPWVEARDEL